MSQEQSLHICHEPGCMSFETFEAFLRLWYCAEHIGPASDAHNARRALLKSWYGPTEGGAHGDCDCVVCMEGQQRYATQIVEVSDSEIGGEG